MTSSPDTGRTQSTWTRLGRVPWWPMLAFASPVLPTFVFLDWLVTALLLPDDGSLLVRSLMAIAIAAAVVALIVISIRLWAPVTWVDIAGGRIRSGRHVAAFHDIVECRLLVSASLGRRTLSLMLGDGHGMRAGVLLRDARDRPLTAKDASALGAAVLGSNIAMPVSREDPKGRFARYNFPDHVTKEEAAQLVAAPPSFGDPLPIPPRV
ncbi:hypothetical protein [Leifsonia sp. Root227]|uniref:hypothetical protein n=1 Tax=Leifsonia sp. Root227 TaxID=1736496 RepID=UPI000AF2BFA2|nr:hypothetical protein [Leifsonia sp. Root227]